MLREVILNFSLHFLHEITGHPALISELQQLLQISLLHGNLSALGESQFKSKTYM